MQSKNGVVVVLGTGGTIAGASASATDNIGYTAAQISIESLLSGVPALAGERLVCEQVAQIDSKDMTAGVWKALVERVAHHLEQPETRGIVVTHGTDTMEETAYLLQRVLAPQKPVVLTGAMRPAGSMLADGPQNLLDGVAVARVEAAMGVVVVAAGQVHGAFDVRKRHSYALDAFGSGDAGVIGRVVEGRLHRYREWPGGIALGADRMQRDPEAWPWVEIVMNYGNADGAVVRLLAEHGVDGIVVAGTGNGTVSERLQAALDFAEAGGVAIVRNTRCAAGGVIAAGDAPDAGDAAHTLTAVQARVDLLLSLLGRERSSPAA